jgi:predicted metal-dependent phosphoesterase TrpH
MIDLHMHTTYSDGASLPEELVKAAIDHGLTAIAVTDHDNTESYEVIRAAAETFTAAEGKALEVIPGIEINTVWNDQEVHILGYYIDPYNANLLALTQRHKAERVGQMHKIAKLLQQKARLKISFEDIAARSHPQGAIGRPHVAQTIVAKGGASTISEAFEKYLNPRQSETYVRRNTVSPHEAVEAIYESGGIPVIAHPKTMEQIETLVEELIHYGLRGLEAYHRSHSPAIIEYHCTLAEKYDLIVTGGTDFHGRPEVYGKALSRVTMPPSIYEGLQRERRNRALSAYKAS